MTMTDDSTSIEEVVFGDEIARLTRDVRAAAALMTRDQARFLCQPWRRLAASIFCAATTLNPSSLEPQP